MSETEKKAEKRQSLLLKLLLVLFDIFAVNFAYYLALLLRFYVNGEFHMAGNLFLPLFLKFAPYYTVCCIIVFWLFRLYNGMWKYAGLNDVNRIVLASLVTCAIQVFGTLLFVRRMPITYYVLGAAIQFVLICASRFSYRIFAVEFTKYAITRNAASVDVAIVGVGETARMLLRQLESGDGNVARPVCVVDCRSMESGRLFDGLPVLNGFDGLRQAVEKYHVKGMIIADSILPDEIRNKVRELCKELGVEAQDFSVYSHGTGDGLSLRKMMECVRGPVELVLDGKARTFANSEDALLATTGRYIVRSVSLRDGRLSVEIAKDTSIPDNTSEAWIHDYEQETGETVSFF